VTPTTLISLLVSCCGLAPAPREGSGTTAAIEAKNLVMGNLECWPVEYRQPSVASGVNGSPALTLAPFSPALRAWTKIPSRGETSRWAASVRTVTGPCVTRTVFVRAARITVESQNGGTPFGRDVGHAGGGTFSAGRSGRNSKSARGRSSSATSTRCTCRWRGVRATSGIVIRRHHDRPDRHRVMDRELGEAVDPRGSRSGRARARRGSRKCVVWTTAVSRSSSLARSRSCAESPPPRGKSSSYGRAGVSPRRTAGRRRAAGVGVRVTTPVCITSRASTSWSPFVPQPTSCMQRAKVSRNPAAAAKPRRRRLTDERAARRGPRCGDVSPGCNSAPARTGRRGAPPPSASQRLTRPPPRAGTARLRGRRGASPPARARQSSSGSCRVLGLAA
jgi:hypothetical protein